LELAELGGLPRLGGFKYFVNHGHKRVTIFIALDIEK